MGGDAQKRGAMWIDTPYFVAGVKLAREANVLKQDIAIDNLVDQRPLTAAARGV